MGEVVLFRRRGEWPYGAVVSAVSEAVAASRLVVIDYVDRFGATTTRGVEPAGLVRGVSGWYLVGWCRLRGDGRSFRLDRVASARVAPEQVPPHVIRDLVPDVPAGFGVLRHHA